ncbi:MAG: c-type cytochrome, partial [Phototrophicaceae bacterium]
MKLDRMLIDGIENRVLVGIACFVATMVIVGWVAINEPARLATFQDQYEGRSIERGAWLFNQNCATCHGVDGLGITGRAPGLNNPHLFGWDPMSAQRVELQTLTRQRQPIAEALDNLAALEATYAGIDLAARLAELEAEASGTVTAERSAEIAVQMGEISLLLELQPQKAELEAQLTDFDTQIASAEMAMDAFVTNNLANAVAVGYTPDVPERLSQVGWEGSLRSYVYTTLVHGRPGSMNYWPAGQGMAAWGQVAGGPLREDELEDLTNYIMNYDRQWTVDDLNAVSQYGIIPGVGGGSDSTEATVGTDVDMIITELVNYTGDPVNGQVLYTSYACVGCHANAAVAPLTEQTWLAAIEGRDGRPHAGDPEQYVIESIVNPGAYVVPPYVGGAMPANFSERITYQEMAD